MDRPGTSAIQASVVYLRVPEFTRRPVAEQARLRAQLDAVLAVVTTELAPEERVLLEAADGAVLLVLHQPGKALRLAERLLSAAGAGLTLAIAINHGAVRLVEQDGEAGFSGDGIATAAAVAGFTSPSNVRVSRAFRDALVDADPTELTALRESGVFTDAGLRSHELFSPDRERGVRLRRTLAVVGIVAILGVVGGSLAYRTLVADRARPLAGVLGKIERLVAAGGAAARGFIEPSQR